jgi:DNA-binding SARP family transcriptional activator
VEFRLLGPVEVAHEGRDIDVPIGKQLNLLTLLLLHANQVVSVDRIIDALWGEDPPAKATAGVHTHVSHLRRSLAVAGDIVLTREPGYVLRVLPGQLDVEQFEACFSQGRAAAAAARWEEAREVFTRGLALHRGPALSQCAAEPFALLAARRMEEMGLAMVEARIEADLAVGRHHEVVPELEALTEAHPFRERLAALRMLALYRSGRQAEALRVYQELRKELAAELGIDPSPALRRLETAILRQEDGLELDADSAVGEFGPSLEIVAGGATQQVLPLRGRVTVGKAEGNDLVVTEDPTVSRVHALFERCGAGWVVRDLGSRNGTFLNGRRVAEAQVLRSGDTIRLGHTSLVFQAPDDAAEATQTATSFTPPPVSDEDRSLLAALCRPLLMAHALSGSTDLSMLASELGEDEAAVSSRLATLAATLGVASGHGPRGLDALAAAAVNQGVVTPADAVGRGVSP